MPFAIVLGEDSFEPERVVDVVNCVTHPLFPDPPRIDMAVCRLAEPINDVPIVPIALGCELENLQPGAEVHIAGFGVEQTFILPSGETEGFGAGIKRFTDQIVLALHPGSEEIDLVSPNGFSGGCNGDSGGSAFLQLPDGSWRVFGIAQSLVYPGGVLPPDSGKCGAGTRYTMIAPQMPWIEQVTNLDISPCFAADGSWDPNPTCTPFPMQIDQSDGSWPRGCAGELGGAPQCGALPSGTTSSTSTTDAGDSSSEGGDGPDDLDTTSTSGAGADSTTSADTGTTSGDVPQTTTEQGTSGAPSTNDDESSGCAFTSTRGSGSAAGLLLLVAALRRRRFARQQRS